jgi:hypothetical protein
MSDPNQTPLKEATSLMTIASILIAVGCYAGTTENAPVLAPGVLWIAGLVFRWAPGLSALHGAQIPSLVGSATVGLAIFLFGIPLAPLLAGAFARAQLQNVERSTARLKKNRANLQKKERAKDDFIVY